MGYEYGDAQNITVRCLLFQFSKKFNFFNDYYKQETLKYFNNKCPYTGIDFSNSKPVMDHIIPFNRKYCGLHIYGNVLFVTNEANKQKHDVPLEIYLKHDPEKLEKIQQFMRESGFTDIHKQYNELLKNTCKLLYTKIRTMIEAEFDYLPHIIPSTTTTSPQHKNVDTVHKVEQIKQSEDIALDQSAFVLLKIDGKSNRFYIYPSNEDQFKEEACTNGEIYVKIIHLDKYVEKITRKVSKKWSTTVYWNINSMPSRYKSVKHLNSLSELQVYASPFEFKC